MSRSKLFSLSQPYDLIRFYRVEFSVMFDIRNLLVDLAKSGIYDDYLDTIVAFLDETDEHYCNPRKDSKRFNLYGKEIKDK